MRSLTSALLALALAAGAAQAQDLEADVVRDPAADLAIYTLDLQGPPGGTAFVFASLAVTVPYQLPIVLNPLYLDPLTVVPVGGATPLGPLGTHGYQFPLPMQPWEHQHIHFQVIALDPAFVLAATNLACGIQGAAPVPAGGGLEWSGSYRTAPGVYTLKLQGAPGAQVRLLVNGGQKGEAFAVLGPDGKATITLPVELEKGDGLSIEQGGQHVHGWTWD